MPHHVASGFTGLLPASSRGRESCCLQHEWQAARRSELGLCILITIGEKEGLFLGSEHRGSLLWTSALRMGAPRFVAYAMTLRLLAEVVEAKAGKGSATLSMAYSGARFGSKACRPFKGLWVLAGARGARRDSDHRVRLSAIQRHRAALLLLQGPKGSKRGMRG